MIAVLIAGAVSMVLSLFGTRALISFFDSIGKGQPILGSDDHGPVHHMKKQGTATMGGIAIMLSAFIGWAVAHLRGGIALSDQAMIMWAICGVLSVIGFLDDFLKVRNAHNRGIFWKKKGYITFGLVVVMMTWLLLGTGVSETLSFTRFDFPGWNLSPILWVVWTSLMVWATTNAVNVTDGLDGLAAGSALFGFLAFTVIAYWAFRNPDIYNLVNPLDLAVFSAAMAGACGGFLWWNAAPARIFMGDVGALGIGAALGLLAVTTNTHMLLPLICALNVMEAGSVALQMGVFKASGRKKRLFRMSPIHHHFELLGWPETTVIIRFWILSGICVAIAVGMFIADFTNIADSFAGR
ncbi:MAG: phospho-N-acetylmuramoyl-pentapeptide-transferase [Ilumatobacteraceae bacterium]|jgi:phospho-N-acetylmuramoyl-pentapeptide-transferase|nr:phospho-N-acetylmuramoyl-pentapeptide-transferase [Ilumatobacteraceae bacterium]MDP5069159.1 phospho-N-acetylmuramoyl-pentapeptide-transferase [Ilumatobacteraceae bacterium]